METRTVLVVDRSGWGMNAPYPAIREVTLRWVCPVCGGPRGEPEGYNFYEDGDTHYCHRWHNPCGHVDMYENVLKEGARVSIPPKG